MNSVSIESIENSSFVTKIKFLIDFAKNQSKLNNQVMPLEERILKLENVISKGQAYDGLPYNGQPPQFNKLDLKASLNSEEAQKLMESAVTKKMRDLNTSEVLPSMGAYFQRDFEAESQAFSNVQEADNSMMKVFDKKLRNLQNHFRGYMRDFADFTHNVVQNKKDIRSVALRISVVENQQEDFDLEDIKDKSNISMDDLIKTMDKYQSNILTKTLTQAELEIQEEKVNDLEEMVENISKRLDKESAFRESLEDVINLPDIVKDLRKNISKNRGLMNEATEEVERCMKKIKDLEK